MQPKNFASNMTMQNDSMSFLSHCDYLLKVLWNRLIHSEDDKDIFQDTFLWMSQHSWPVSEFEARFINRFKWIKIAAYSEKKYFCQLDPNLAASAPLMDDITICQSKNNNGKTAFIKRLKSRINH